MIEVYDIETYPNVFTYTGVNVETCECTVFEISDRVDNSEAFRAHINTLHYQDGSMMIGFNSEHFDYPVIHHMMQQQVMTAQNSYDKAMEIINTPWNDKFRHFIWENERLVRQLDLFKVHHFDNISRSTSLKMLEFNMRSESVQDLPFPVGTILTSEQIDTLIEYNIHDVMQTWKFYMVSKPKIDFRKELSRKFHRNMLNFNDTKIGKEHFIMELEKAGVQCFTTSPKKPIQTLRTRIDLKDAIMPSIHFEQPEFNRILNWLKQQTIVQTKGVFEDVNCTVNDFTFVFGLGGIHGSIESRALRSDETHVLIDLDVTSYYPNIAITNRFFPAHLGEVFCDIYRDVFEQRKSYPKGTAENAALKLALNGVYGDSNNAYSCFYDSLYTMKITINGQLLLCMLAEALMTIPGLEMIQINTDGLTVRVPRGEPERLVTLASKYWEGTTGLNLESVEYNRMWIRDVNNYIAEDMDGKLKRKGAYGYGKDLDWNQDHGGQVIAKAAEASLVRGHSVRHFIETHLDMYDFYLATKVPRSSHLLLVDDRGEEEILQNITRYYISATGGGSLIKVMPPIAKKPDEWRRFQVQAGWKVQPCNNIKDATARINYEYYIQRAEKLLV